jgi:uncharacterized membrane protein
MPIFACIIGSLASTIRDLYSKSLSNQVPGIVSASASFIYALPIYLILLLLAYIFGYEDFQLGSSFLLLVILRSSTDAMAEWLKMCSLKGTDISLVSPFFSLAPLFLLFTSPVITGDNISDQGLLGVLIVVIGTIVVGLKSFSYSKANRKSILLALASAFFLSLNSCFDRLAVLETSPLLSSASMNLGAAIILFFICISGRNHSQLLMHKSNFFMRGIFEVCFMVLKLYALQTLPAPYVMGIMRISIVFSVIAGWKIFKEDEFVKRLIGSILILIGTGVIVFGSF